MLQLRQHVYMIPLKQWHKSWKPLLQHYFQDLHSSNWYIQPILANHCKEQYIQITLKNCPVGIATYYTFPIWDTTLPGIPPMDMVLQHNVQQIIQQIQRLKQQKEQGRDLEVTNNVEWNFSALQLDQVFQDISLQLNIVRACRIPLNQPAEPTECIYFYLGRYYFFVLTTENIQLIEEFDLDLQQGYTHTMNPEDAMQLNQQFIIWQRNHLFKGTRNNPILSAAAADELLT